MTAEHAAEIRAKTRERIADAIQEGFAVLTDRSVAHGVPPEEADVVKREVAAIIKLIRERK